MKKLYLIILLICMASTGYAQSCENNTVAVVEISNTSGATVTVSLASSSTVSTLPFGDTEMFLYNVPIDNNTIYVKTENQTEVCAIYIPNYAQNSTSLQSLTFNVITTGYNTSGVATIGCSTPVAHPCSSQ